MNTLEELNTVDTSFGPIILASIYRQAAEIVDTWGWARGINVNSNGGRCLGAAVNEAAGRGALLRTTSDDIMWPLAAWLVQNRGSEVSAAFTLAGYNPSEVGTFPGDALNIVQRWNDAAGRTKEQVVAVLRDLAASLSPVDAAARTAP